MIRTSVAVLASALVALGASLAQAEPMFLSKQYTRCATCHYSPTGGGLLTPYGRSLSHQELSTTGKRPLPSDAEAMQSITGEEAFLWGIFGEKLGPVHAGIDLRPSHLEYSSSGIDASRNLFMNADLLATYQVNHWTLYGQIGRQPESPGWTIDSYEYWLSYQSNGGTGFRVGRFLPAYGVRFADHTAFNRSYLGFEKYDQIYGVELSRTSERSLMQVSVGPGFADAVIDDDGRRAFTATGRFQIDLSPRTVVVASGLYRDSSDVQPRNGASGVAFGFAPASRVTVWTQLDAQFMEGTSEGRSYILVNETAVEAIRGLWLKVSPQLRTADGDASPGVFRLQLEADWLPRTHWNVDVSYYRDRNRTSDLVSHIFLAQLHLYL